VTERQALIHVDALFRVPFVDDVAAVAETKIAGAVGQIVATVLAASAGSLDLILTPAGLVAALLVGPVAAVVLQVTDLRPVDAVAVAALEVAEQVGAGSRPVGAEGHVVLVRPVAAVVLAVADVVPRNALEVVALELLDLVAGEVLAQLLRLVRLVAAVVLAVAEVVVVDADVILALVLVLGTVAAVGEPRRAVLFIGQVGAVAFAVALELGLDAVARITLEAVLLASVTFTVLIGRMRKSFSYQVCETGLPTKLLII
jgi:hypothetical protein